MNGIGTHHRSCNSIDGCILTVLLFNVYLKTNAKKTVGVNPTRENFDVGCFVDRVRL